MSQAVADYVNDNHSSPDTLTKAEFEQYIKNNSIDVTALVVGGVTSSMIDDAWELFKELVAS